jgi:1-acyl-sn-glycerol-3-phosphate acyltransferase
VVRNPRQGAYLPAPLKPSMSFTRPARPPLTATLWTRLFFVWGMFWGALMTVPFSIGMLIHSLFSPSAATFKWWLSRWGRGILAATGVRLRTLVRQPIPEEQPVVFVANHHNMLDIVTCAVGIPHSYAFTAKVQLRDMPFVGAVLARSASVFVDRSSARRAVESVREAAEIIRKGTSVLVYVEGERSFGRDLLPFLRGAFVLAVEAAVPLVPVVILDNFEVMDERRRVARPGPVHLVVGAPIPTAGRSREAIPELMEHVRAVMEQELATFHGGRPEEPAGSGVSSGSPQVHQA